MVASHHLFILSARDYPTILEVRVLISQSESISVVGCSMEAARRSRALSYIKTNPAPITPQNRRTWGRITYFLTIIISSYRSTVENVHLSPLVQHASPVCANHDTEITHNVCDSFCRPGEVSFVTLKSFGTIDSTRLRSFCLQDRKCVSSWKGFDCSDSGGNYNFWTVNDKLTLGDEYLEQITALLPILIAMIRRQ
ncbi:hypothetical protein TNCV_579801 [Trichonephila clavipes]|nr:hypothetical protein TNCV_579801 [Trichonephila clavipes]